MYSLTSVLVQVEYVDAGTPITNSHYLGSPRGEIYGADHGIARFNPELNATVRAQTPLKNLYLTGQFIDRVLHNITDSVLSCPCFHASSALGSQART